ncbi:hypothetical protein [Dyella sp. EPa41]|uniref:hypothetical protein n=1 Tax=Dyella sp. EPa41 TaxID=1561194 RepID=UPI001916ADA2|nr:hypothetical protein [Dyella sp. EPa41]
MQIVQLSVPGQGLVLAEELLPKPWPGSDAASGTHNRFIETMSELSVAIPDGPCRRRQFAWSLQVGKRLTDHHFMDILWSIITSVKQGVDANGSLT